MPDLIAAIDAGTTSTRCTLYDRNGPVARAQREHRQMAPRPGWLEHDPEELWANTAAVVSEARARVPGRIVAVGLTNQRETTLLWDRDTGRPVGNAVVWSDARTGEICRRLAAEGGVDRFRAKTGLPVADYFSGVKLAWMLDHLPGLRDRADAGGLCFGTVDTWLLSRLTGRHVTDVTNACRTQLFDIHTLAWDDDLLRAHGVPASVLPDVQPSVGGDFGFTRADGPFSAAVPVTAVLGDQQAALFGQACFSPGEAKCTYGTGCFMLLHTGTTPAVSRHGLLTTVACQVAGERATYALEGSVAVAGALVQWLRDNLNVIGTSGEVERLADSVPDAGGVIFVPAFGGLFAPHWDATARGTILGLTAHTTRAHLARAALDATAFQVADVADAMHADTGRPIDLLRADGGMSVNDRLMQFQADVLGVPVERPADPESTAAGVAYAAGLACGYLPGVEAVTQARRVERVFEPSPVTDALGARRRDWSRAVSRAQGWIQGDSRE